MSTFPRVRGAVVLAFLLLLTMLLNSNSLALAHSSFDFQKDIGYTELDTRTAAKMPSFVTERSFEEKSEFVHLFYGAVLPSTSLYGRLIARYSDNLFLWFDESNKRYRLMAAIPVDVDRVEYLNELKLIVEDAFIWTWHGYSPKSKQKALQEFIRIEGSIDFECVDDCHPELLATTDQDTKEALQAVNIKPLEKLAKELDGKNQDEFTEAFESFARNEIRDHTNSYANSKIEDYLGDYVTTLKTDLRVDSDFESITGEVHALQNVHTTETSNVFVQGGVVFNSDKNFEGRDFLNLGMGYRNMLLTSDTMYGINGFWDYDLDRGHQRASIGGELWHKELGLKSNYYFPVSDWKDSTKMLDDMMLEERPANAFDVQLSGYMREMPWLEGSITYQQYLGENIAVENGDMKDNPYSIKSRISYTPIPLLEMGASYLIGSSREPEFSANIGVKYVFGESIENQLNPAYVQKTKNKLYQQRTELVERNNNIVLEHRKKAASLTLVKDHIVLDKGDVINTRNLVKVSGERQIAKYAYSGNAVPHIDLFSVIKAKQVNNYAQYKVSSINQNFLSTENGEYQLTFYAILHDNSVVASKPLRITVQDETSLLGNFSNVVVKKNNAIADGVDKNEIMVELKDSSGNPMAGEMIVYSATNGAKVHSPVTTDSNGVAMLEVSSLVAMPTNITIKHKESTARVQLNFVDGLNATGHGGISVLLTITENGVASNNIDTNIISLHLTDANGVSLAGEQFEVVTSSQVSSDSKVTTDAAGIARIMLRSSFRGEQRVTVIHSKSGIKLDVNVEFSSSASLNNPSSKVEIIKNNAIANLKDDGVVRVTLTKADGLPAVGETIFMEHARGEAHRGHKALTDQNGIVEFGLVSREAGTLVAVIEHNDIERIIFFSFIGDESTASIGNANSRVEITKNNAAANGVDKNIVTVVLTDAYGNLIEGEVINAKVNGADINQPQLTTNQNGEAIFEISSMTAGIKTATIEHDGIERNVEVKFNGDPATADITNIHSSVIVTADSAVANDADTNILDITLKDASGNPVSGELITFEIVRGDAKISRVTGRTNHDGRLRNWLRSSVPSQWVDVRIHHNGKFVERTVWFDEKTVSINDAQIDVRTSTVVANGVDEHIVVITMYDTQGQIAPHEPVEVQLPSGTPGVSYPKSLITGVDGIAVLRVTSQVEGDILIRIKHRGVLRDITLNFLPK